MRDYRRPHPENAARYGQIKRECTAAHGHDLNGCHECKDPCVETLTARAQAWAEAKG